MKLDMTQVKQTGLTHLRAFEEAARAVSPLEVLATAQKYKSIECTLEHGAKVISESTIPSELINQYAVYVWKKANGRDAGQIVYIGKGVPKYRISSHTRMFTRLTQDKYSVEALPKRIIEWMKKHKRTKMKFNVYVIDIREPKVAGTIEELLIEYVDPVFNKIK